MDVATGEKTPVTPKGGEPVAYGGAALQRRRQGPLRHDRQGVGVPAPRLPRPRQRQADATSRSHIPWDVDELRAVARRPDDRVRHQRGRPERAAPARHASRQGEAAPPRLPVGVIGGLELAQQRPRPRARARPRRARRPTSTRSTSTTGKLERWTESETGGLNAAELLRARARPLEELRRPEISGFLYQPRRRASPARGPVIINIHGGPEGQSRPGFLGRDNYFVDELGVAILYPNVRGSTGFGKTLPQARQRRAARGLGQGHRRAPRLDRDPHRTSTPSRVMVTGGSYGGYMTLAVATHYDATASAARSTSWASRTSSRSWRTPRPTAATCAASSTATSAIRR